MAFPYWYLFHMLNETKKQFALDERAQQAAAGQGTAKTGAFLLTFSTSNYQAMLKFFRDFNFNVEEGGDQLVPFFENGRGARVSRGDFDFQLEESKSPGKRACFNLCLADVADAEIEAIKAKGYTCDYESFGHTHTFRMPDGGKLVI
ncbi:MAG TPA: hypothetical protein VF773_00780 [Verrucomicrobiae bacterium]